MGLSDTGESGLIGQIRSRLSSEDERVLLGIGDDTAIIRTRPGWDALLTTDSMVEQIHFDLAYTPLDALGWKIMVINLSDIAAMGGTPVCAVISLAIPGTWSIEMIDRLYQGVQEAGRTYVCPVAGGDTVRVPRDSMITVTVLGEVESGRAIRRSGACPGDCLCVTGPLGKARTGLEALAAGNNNPAYSAARKHFLKPVPHLDVSRQLVQYGGVTSMVDISDGLSMEIHHLCEESGTGCRVDSEQIPVAAEARNWCAERNRPLIPHVMESGEEYELLFTMRPEAFNRLQKNACNGVSPIWKIGEICDPSEGICLVGDDGVFSLDKKGWDHFQA